MLLILMNKTVYTQYMFSEYSHKTGGAKGESSHTTRPRIVVYKEKKNWRRTATTKSEGRCHGSYRA